LSQSPDYQGRRHVRAQAGMADIPNYWGVTSNSKVFPCDNAGRLERRIVKVA